MTVREASLFDVEDAEQLPHVRDMSVASVSTADIGEFCRRYHYTGVGHGAQYPWRWGLWHGPVLHGVVAYNLPTRSVCESVFGSQHAEKVWHMGRLALADSSPRNSESRLIGGSLRIIQREHPHVWAVVTYAASDAGHIGTVYQATNALYTGTGGHLKYYRDRQGRRHTTYLRGRQITPAKRDELGWTEHLGGVKHRYIYLLGSARQRRMLRRLLAYPVLPYPKPTQVLEVKDSAAC